MAIHRVFHGVVIPPEVYEAQLSVNEFRVYAQLAYMAATQKDIQVYQLSIAEKCKMRPIHVCEAIEELEHRRMIVRQKNCVVLTDESEWLGGAL